jgi:hypothetical protein
MAGAGSPTLLETTTALASSTPVESGVEHQNYLENDRF